MKAVLMAGGKGTRLTGITKDLIPKPMAPLMGKPILEWQIEQLKSNGINDFIIITGHLGEVIRDYFKDGSAWNVNISYYHEEQPLGTAGALVEIRDMLDEEPFFLGFGDILFDIDLCRMKNFHKQKRAIITLFAHPNDHPADSDVLVLDSNQRVTGVLKKNQPRNQWYDNCVNAGLYIVDKKLCKQITRGVKTDLEKDLIIPMTGRNEAVYAYTSPEYVKDIGTVERIKEAETALKSGRVQQKNLKNKQRAFFLDRDGTINKHKGLIWQEEQLELEEYATEAIRKINEAGWLAIVITNQPSVARGLCETIVIEIIHRKLQTLLGKQGAYLDAIYYCPHHPDRGYPEENPVYKIPCNCRKPKTGLVNEAGKRFNIDFSQSWFIGDTTMDIQTGINAGIHTALVRTGEGGKDRKFNVQADLEALNLLEAVKQILLKQRKKK